MACLPANGEKGRKHVPGERAEFFFFFGIFKLFFFFFLKEKFAEEIFFFYFLSSWKKIIDFTIVLFVEEWCFYYENVL